MSVGRSVDEILRVITALQIAEGNEISLPEGWMPGDKAVLNPPASREDTSNDSNAKAWYYREVDLPLKAAS